MNDGYDLLRALIHVEPDAERVLVKVANGLSDPVAAIVALAAAGMDVDRVGRIIGLPVPSVDSISGQFVDLVVRKPAGAGVA